MVRETYVKAGRVARNAIDTFRVQMDKHCRSGGAVSIRLKPGEALFVDNKVMFHGRNAIRPDSTRSLIRSYVV